jgi:drug/metabolite transporter (DMT)-like permease
MLLLAGLSWGAAAALSKVALAQLAAADLFGIEVAVSAPPLILLALSRGARPSRPDPLLVLLGLLEPGLTYLLFDVGVTRTAASHASLLLAADAPTTLLLAWLFLRERVDIAMAASLTFGVTGSVLVAWQGGGDASLAGDVLVVASAVTAAMYGVLARYVAMSRDPVVVTAVQMCAALLLALPVFLSSWARGHSRLADADAGHVTLGVLVGLLGGVVPFLLFNWAVSQVTASSAGLVLVIVPVVGAGLSVLVVGERVSVLAGTGGALALVAAAIAARRTDG